MENIYQNKPWIECYPESVEKDIKPIKHQNLVEFYNEFGEKYKSRVAFQSFGVELTFNQVQVASKRIATWLKNKHPKGSRIALISPNTLSYPIIVQAIHRAGMVAVNINPLLTHRELSQILIDSGVQTVFIWNGSAHLLDQVGQEVKNQINTVVVTKISHYFPKIKGLIFDFVLKKIKKLIADFDLYGYKEVLSLDEINQNDEITNENEVYARREDMAFLQYTGGTTGRSKGVILTHGNLLSNITQATQFLPSDIHYCQNVITALPLYHIFALTANFYVMYGIGIKNILITNPRDIANFIKILIANPPHIMVGVNTLFNALTTHTDITKVDFSQLQLSLGGGMSVQKSTSDKWVEITGCFILEAYGLSETSPAVTINPYDVSNFTGSIGLPVPGTEINIINEKNQSVALGEEGELCVRGPQVTQGYWKNAEATKEAFTQEGNWFKTGDIVKMDEKGYIYLLDRKKDMVIVSGFNVYPVEVEQVINQIAGVFECSCIGVADEKTGETVKAFIIKEEGSHLNEQQIIDQCKDKLTSYKVPKHVEFVKDFPRSNVGKVLRRKLVSDQ